MVIGAILLLGPASTLAAQQQRGGVPTETQERQRLKFDPAILWNGLGLLGLLGLLGFRKGHDEDSYHPSGFE
jgi:hypothetical protein